MPNPSISTEVRQRLLNEGFARAYANRTARELREHWEDLVEESIRHGLTRDHAESQANSQIGLAQHVGDELAARLHSTSWLGRNPTAGFAALALVTTIVWWAVFLMAAGALTGLWTWDSAPPDNLSWRLQILATCVDWTRTLSYFVIPFLICFISQRYACGWKPALWGCLIVAIHNATHFFRVNNAGNGHGDVMWGYSFSTTGPDLLPIFTPIAVFLLFTLWRLRPEPNEESSDLQAC